MQTLAQWAERLLMGQSLDDKLASPGPLVDEAHAAWSTPESPGRPAGLRLHRRVGANTPSLHALDDNHVRGQVLHQFANHELLALELMALLLLRFPEAPPELRRTLVATMCDEQRHMRLYLDRMNDLGVQLGEVPVNAFFWDCLAHVADPLAFIAGMSLGFEQANLDFAAHWMRSFSTVGDDETVAILERVHRDEIRHVAHGVVWLERLKAPEQDSFEAWQQALTFPLTARRARGPAFQHDARVQAGMSASFIERVRGAGHSKGRPPKLFWFHPWCEEQHAGTFTPSKPLISLAADLAPCMIFAASDDDVVVLPRLPSAGFVAQIAAVGAPTPQLVQGDDPVQAMAGERPLHSLRPWGWSEQALLQCKTLLPRVQTAPTWTRAQALLSRKDHAADVLSGLAANTRVDTDAGQVCSEIAQVVDARQRWPDVLVKAPLSASGRNRRRIRGELSAADLRWAEQAIRGQGTVVVEPWRRRLVDLSLHGTVTDHGLRTDGVTRFFTDPSGRFRGTLLDRWTRGLPAEHLRWVHQPRGWVQTNLRNALQCALHKVPSYRGPVSLDAFVWTDGEQLYLRPLVEVNARPTFSRVALSVQRNLLSPRSSGAWIFADLRSTKRAGFKDLQHLAQALADELPLDGSPLTRGALCTTDPSRCERVLTVLIAGETWTDVQAQWRSFTAHRPSMRGWIGES